MQSASPFKRLVLVALVIVIAIVACRCNPNMETTCISRASSPEEAANCTVFVYNTCPEANPADPEAVAAMQTCFFLAINAFYGGDPVPPLNYEPYLPAANTAPTPTPQVQLSAPGLCNPFRMTSPLDGLPNGVATFYWDPANGSPSYRVVVMDENHSTLAVFPAGQSTNVSGDVSQGAIGGGFQLWVRVEAYNGNLNLCQDEHLLMRAAPNGSQPQSQPTRGTIVIPLPTPTQEPPH